jgi:hypothetical protein
MEMDCSWNGIKWSGGGSATGMGSRTGKQLKVVEARVAAALLLQSQKDSFQKSNKERNKNKLTK